MWKSGTLEKEYKTQSGSCFPDFHISSLWPYFVSPRFRDEKLFLFAVAA